MKLWIVTVPASLLNTKYELMPLTFPIGPFSMERYILWSVDWLPNEDASPFARYPLYYQGYQTNHFHKLPASLLTECVSLINNNLMHLFNLQ